MQEEFLHYIWRRGFERKSLVTVSGESVMVMNTGEQNRDSGPDFFNAMVRIGSTTWAGSVEIHVRASDWSRHGHDRDAAYDNVILHAVYEYDTPVYRTSGEEIPAISMREHIPEEAYKAYLDFLNNHLWIPCAHELARVPAAVSRQHLENLCQDRLERRKGHIIRMLADNRGDWNQAFFISLAGSLGTRVNKDPFEMMARATPVQVILKCRYSLTLLEALLFGQAGMLDPALEDEYPRALASEYQHLKKKHALQSIPCHLWKFLRLRPVNFPTIRIAQLAAIYHQCPLPFGIMIDEQDTGRWQQLFNAGVSPYWRNHYQFDRVSGEKEKGIGQETIHLIFINTVIPFLYRFGEEHDNPALARKAIDLLKQLPAESNSIIHGYTNFGLEFHNAMESQGGLELKKHWCDLRRCLDCRIGHELLKIAL